MTSTTTETAPAVVLTEEQRAAVFDLSVLPYGTILRDDKFGQAWQIGRVQKKDRETLKDLGTVPVISTIGCTDTWELALDGGPENTEMLAELLDGTTYEVAWTPSQVPVGSALAGQSEFEAEYEWLIGPLSAAGIGPRLLQTGGPGCYVIRIDLADGALIEIGSDAGPLGQPGEPGRSLEAVWYADEESTGSQGDLLGSAQCNSNDVPAMVEAILTCVVAAKKAAAANQQPQTDPLRAAAQRVAEHFTKGALVRVDATLAGFFINEYAPELLGETDAEYHANCVALSTCVHSAELIVTVPGAAADPLYQHEPVPAPGDSRYCYRCGALVEDGHCVIPPSPPLAAGDQVEVLFGDYAGRKGTIDGPTLSGFLVSGIEEEPVYIQESALARIAPPVR